MAVPFEKLTKEKTSQIKLLILSGSTDEQIMREVFENKNGHHTWSYYSVIKRIRKSIK